VTSILTVPAGTVIVSALWPESARWQITVAVQCVPSVGATESHCVIGVAPAVAAATASKPKASDVM
jgi:hypothetical protein